MRVRRDSIWRQTALRGAANLPTSMAVTGRGQASARRLAAAVLCACAPRHSSPNRSSIMVRQRNLCGLIRGTAHEDPRSGRLLAGDLSLGERLIYKIADQR